MGCPNLTYYQEPDLTIVHRKETLTSKKSSENLRSSYRFGFNGQEKDDEITGVTGSHYTAEFWEYDSRIGRRWNIDPVDKPWMSSYHAFSNKPIWNIDPNGASDRGYTLDDDGNVNEIEGQGANDYGGREYDVLFKKSDFDAGKTAESDGLTVNNTKILSDLSTKDDEGRSISQGHTTGSIDDVFKVFKFAADYTKVEWGLVRYQSDKYAVYTSHISDEIAIPDRDMNLPSVNAFIHNHPRAFLREWNERSSMGDVIRPDTKQHQRFSGSDWWTKKYEPLNYEFYAYFSNTDTKRLYHIGENKITKVSNIKTFKDFYFGTLNHR